MSLSNPSPAVPLRCVVTDDDPFNRLVLEQYVHQLSGLSLAGSFTNGEELLTYLGTHSPVELLLLDVEMPGLSGLDVIARLPYPVTVVLTTAHRNFAVDAFALDVADYLLKPVSFLRFCQCLYQLQPQLAPPFALASPPPPSPPLPPPPLPNGLFVKSHKRSTWLPYEHIHYVEAVNDCAVVVTAQRQLSINHSLAVMSQRLPAPAFVRVHRSFVVNTRAIETINEHDILLRSGRLIPIGRTYQVHLHRHIAHYGVIGSTSPKGAA